MTAEPLSDAEAATVAVDLDALDKLRAAAAEWMRTHLFWGLDPSKAPEAAEMLCDLPEFADLLADARRYRALRGEPGKPRRYAPCPRCGALNGGAGQAGHYNRCTRPALAAVDPQ